MPTLPYSGSSSSWPSSSGCGALIAPQPDTEALQLHLLEQTASAREFEQHLRALEREVAHRLFLDMEAALMPARTPAQQAADEAAYRRFIADVAVATAPRRPRYVVRPDAHRHVITAAF